MVDSEKDKDLEAEQQSENAGRLVGVIDIGSNSIRMELAEIQSDGRIELLEKVQRPVHLGQDAFLRGKLGSDTMSAAIEILRDYRRIINSYDVETIRTVATSSLREAGNRDAFIDRVARTVDLDVDVIEQTEQSRLIVSAVLDDSGEVLGLRRKSAMVAEVGGGGTLITILRRGEIAATQSYILGSVRMLEMLAISQEQPERAADLVRKHIMSTVEMAKSSLRLRSIGTFVAIGGDARFAAQQVGENITGSELVSVSSSALDSLVAECVRYTPEELSAKYGLPYADAEPLVPALLVYQALLEATRAEAMIVSQVSMRDGLLLDIPRYITGKDAPELIEGILHSAKSIGYKYRFDGKHAEQVAELSLRIFDEMEKEHGLSSRDRLLLNVAALLHDIGMYVSNKAHHKHSGYLISNAEIIGLRRADVAVVAQVSRYHRKTVPKLSHPEYVAMPRDRRMLINKLAAILRVADALDRGHWQQVRDFTFERKDRELTLYVKGAADLALERRALEEKADLFEDMFGLKVRLEEDAGQSAPIS
ncbi:MAG: HD domain-containing protein [Candidatus Hydrogenedentota bacterium]